MITEPFRYLRLFFVQFRTSFLLAAQYRVEFLVDGVVSLVWTVASLVPLWVVFEQRAQVVGWSLDEALLVLGWFTLLNGVLEGAVNPSLGAVVEHIRRGTLDLILLKPVDAQFLVSTSRFQVWRFINVIAALIIFGVALTRLRMIPSLTSVLTSCALLGLAIGALYSIWILVISTAFFVVRVDNLHHFFTTIFDAARWPVNVYPKPVRFIFTFVLPLALMTTFPAEALLGKITPLSLLRIALLSIAFMVLARKIWLRALRHYASASS